MDFEKKVRINGREVKYVTFDKAVRKESRYSERSVITYISYPQLFVPTDILVDSYIDKMKIFIPLCRMLSRLDDIYKSYQAAPDEESRFYCYRDANVHLRYCYKQLGLMVDLYTLAMDAYARIYRYLLSLDVIVDDWVYDFDENLWSDLRVLSDWRYGINTAMDYADDTGYVFNEAITNFEYVGKKRKDKE